MKKGSKEWYDSMKERIDSTRSHTFVLKSMISLSTQSLACINYKQKRDRMIRQGKRVNCLSIPKYMAKQEPIEGGFPKGGYMCRHSLERFKSGLFIGSIGCRRR